MPQQLLAQPQLPDTIFGVDNATACAAMKQIHRPGLRIPTDVALVGITDEYHATVVEPTLTSIMHPTFEIGRTAALLFLEQATGCVPPRQVVLTTHLVVRESSGIGLAITLSTCRAAMHKLVASDLIPAELTLSITAPLSA